MSDTTKDDKPADLMGYENQIETPSGLATAPTGAPEDVQSLINRTVKEVTVDEKTGKYIYPDGIDPVLKAAVAATKSYRDNQSGFTKSQQSLKESEAEVTALREKLAGHTSKSLELTKEDQQTLDNLRDTDPDAWRQKLNRLESEAKTTIKEELDSATEEARSKASGDFELQQRYDYLDQFNEGRDVPITPELLDSEIPPRITKKLADGDITFVQYLDDVSEYIDKGKVVATTPDTKTTDLNKANGSSKAGEQAEEEGQLDYTSMTL